MYLLFLLYFQLLLACLIALSQAALLPIDTSVVKVKSENSGQDYSYSIQENRGFAIDTLGPEKPAAPEDHKNTKKIHNVAAPLKDALEKKTAYYAPLVYTYPTFPHIPFYPQYPIITVPPLAIA